jgi:hypothetical protein
MKKRLITSLAIALILIATLALPALAIQEDSTTATVHVSETVSISLAGSIAFGTLSAGTTEAGASGQGDGTPAITFTVEEETNTNVDIAIKGAIDVGNLALINWLYSTDYAKTDLAGLTTDYADNKAYTNVGNGDYAFYHWITIPSDADAGDQQITVSYKAVETGGTF